MNCPHCGKEIEPQQRRAAVARWASMTAEERSAEMSRRRKKGIKKRAPTKKPRQAKGHNVELFERHE